jgi:hypothetical protein
MLLSHFGRNPESCRTAAYRPEGDSLLQGIVFSLISELDYSRRITDNHGTWRDILTPRKHVVRIQGNEANAWSAGPR